MKVEQIPEYLDLVKQYRNAILRELFWDTILRISQAKRLSEYPTMYNRYNKVYSYAQTRHGVAFRESQTLFTQVHNMAFPPIVKEQADE